MPNKTENISTSRPPIVVVMGHVDHGKTSLLDAIRSADVASGEHGGITQSIGAYQVTLNTQHSTLSTQLTFIDTPGHQAFTQMRSHGAKVADIAILVVAANDSVMPQTIESIKIIKETKIPYVVAINKIDLPEANFDKVVKDLLKHEVLLENYGGDIPFVKVSAKKKEGIKELLELIELMWEMQEVKSNQDDPLEAIVIESKLDKNRGPVASAVVRNGKISAGDKIYIDGVESKVRGLFDYLQKPLKAAIPGQPVEIIGLSKVPSTGSIISQTLTATVTDSSSKTNAKSGSSDTQLNVVIKADVLGSLEAILGLIPDNVNLRDSGVGEITASDIILAKETKSIILGFNTNVNQAAKKLLESEKVLVRTYKIIYELLDELRDAADGMLVIEQEETLGAGQIIALFPFNGAKVAGTKITEGRLAKGDSVKVFRGETVLIEAKIKSVRVGKDEVTKVEIGKECGIFLDPQPDLAPGDKIVAYKKY